MDAAMPAPPGSVIAGYRLDAQIGRGPMGRVYRAIHPRSGQACAIKLYKPHQVSAAGMRRFRELAEFAASTPGSGAVRILEVVVDGDAPFATMDLVTAEGLASRLQRGPLAWEEACSLIERVTVHVAALHGAGLTHGNLKPTNVALDSDTARERGVHLFDVGSHALRTQVEGGSTRAHDFFPVDYQAPEQLLGDALGPPADLYALGVILHEMIAGERPFTGAIAEIAYQHLRADPPPLRRRVTTIPGELDALVQRLLAKDPADRPDALALAAALRALRRPRTAAPIDDEASTQLWTREQLATHQAPSPHTVVSPRQPLTAGPPAHTETVMLPPPPPSRPGDSASITLVPEDIGPEFLQESTGTTQRRAKMETNIRNNPGATIFVDPGHLAAADPPPSTERASRRRWWGPLLSRARHFLQGPWPPQKKLLALNILCMIIVLVGLVAILSSG